MKDVEPELPFDITQKGISESIGGVLDGGRCPLLYVSESEEDNPDYESPEEGENGNRSIPRRLPTRPVYHQRWVSPAMIEVLKYLHERRPGGNAEYKHHWKGPLMEEHSKTITIQEALEMTEEGEGANAGVRKNSVPLAKWMIVVGPE